MESNIRKDIKDGKLYRLQNKNVAVLYDKEEDEFVVGFIGERSLNYKDLVLLNEVTSELLKDLENEEL